MKPQHGAKPAARKHVDASHLHRRRSATAGRGLPPGAVAIMLMLCLSWGFNQIAVKLALSRHSADAAGDDPLRRRAAGDAARRLAARRQLFQRDGTLLPASVRGSCSASSSC
jgi:hypothetical protein